MKPKFMFRSVMAAGLALVLCEPPLSAHHAASAVFDMAKPIRFLDATVTQFQFVNPHAWIYVDVRMPDGKVENWGIEVAPPNALVLRGLTKDMIKLGMKLVIDGYPSKDGSKRASGRELTLPDGKSISLPSAEFSPGTSRDVAPSVPGAWWNNAAVVRRVGLTDEQKAKIERAFENHRQRIVSATEWLEKEEAQLAGLLDTEPLDRNAILAQIDRVIQWRSEMERANAAMTLEMREHLTRAQWSRLPRTVAPQTAPSTMAPGQRGREE